MSPTKKLILSIGGAILGHLVLFALIAGLLLLSLLAGPPQLNAALVTESQPKEITISFSELIEKLEIIPPEPETEKEEPEDEKADSEKPEEEAEEEPGKKDRNFVRTFADQETAEAPKNARFQSDRNSEVASDSPPDPSDSKAIKDAPNVNGRDLPFLTMRDRKFIDGEFLDQEFGGASSAASAGSPPQPPAEQEPQQQDSPDPFKESKPAESNLSEDPSEKNPDESDPDSPPETEIPERAGPLMESAKAPDSDVEEQPKIVSDETMKSEAELAANPQEAPEKVDPSNPADAPNAPTNPAEEAAQPNTRKLSADPQMAEAQKSFVLPLQTGAPIINDAPADRDRMALAERVEENVGPAADLETPKPFSSTMATAPTAPLPPPAVSEQQQRTQQQMAEPLIATPVQPTQIPAPTIAESPPINPPAVQTEKPSFLAEMARSKVSGTLSNVKKSAAFDAEKTPLGQYTAAVNNAIERKWHRYRTAKADFVTWGSMKVKFRVDRNGNIKDLEMVENKANTIMAEFTLRAILDAEIPKMPQSISELIGARGLQMNYDIFIH